LTVCVHILFDSDQGQKWEQFATASRDVIALENQLRDKQRVGFMLKVQAIKTEPKDRAMDHLNKVMASHL